MNILFLSGDKAGSRQEIGPNGAGIGRETDNEIQYLGGRVSRYHAKIEKRPEGWFILDLGSTNGTKLNGQLISAPVKLNDGDVVAVGELMFRIEDKAPAVQSEPTVRSFQRTEKMDPPPAFVFRAPGSIPDTVTPSASPQDTPAAAKEEPRQETETKTAAGESEPKTVVLQEPEPKKDPPDAEPAHRFDLDHLFTKHDHGKVDSSPETVNNRKKRVINLLFVLMVVAVAAVALLIFVRLQETENEAAMQNQPKRVAIPNPFLLYYEKREITKDNSVFCFKLQLENGHLSFSLDDLQSGRVYSPSIPEPVRPEAIDKLQKAIADTNFMTAEQQEKLSDSAENDKNYARIIVGFEDKFNDIVVQDIVLTSFSQVENAIREFLEEEYGIDSSMAESRDELIRRARSFFDLAEKQYRSYKVEPGNLWRCIENYKIAMRRYEVFAQKPQEWTIARTHLAEAEAKLKKIREDGHDVVNLYYQQKEYKKACDECTRLLEFFSTESETYRNVRSMKIKLEKIMNEGR